MKPNESKYLDVLKIVEFLAEGGSETLYRLLPYGEARRGTGGAGVAPRRDARPGVNFVWRIYGNSIGENDDGEEIWEDFNAEYEDIGEYLIDREEMLACLYPRYIDPNFREQIFDAFLTSLRQTTSVSSTWLFGESQLFGNWPEWQKQLKLTAPQSRIVVYSPFKVNPIESLTLDYSAIRSAQEMLNCIYNALLAAFVARGKYGQSWILYDMVECRQLHMPPDDRDDSLRAAGITSGALLMVVPL